MKEYYKLSAAPKLSIITGDHCLTGSLEIWIMLQFEKAISYC